MQSMILIAPLSGFQQAPGGGLRNAALSREWHTAEAKGGDRRGAWGAAQRPTGDSTGPNGPGAGALSPRLARW